MVDYSRVCLLDTPAFVLNSRFNHFHLLGNFTHTSPFVQTFHQSVWVNFDGKTQKNKMIAFFCCFFLMQWKYFFQKWFNLSCEQSSVLWTQKRQNLSFSLKFLAGEGTNKSVSETMVQLLKISQTANTLQEQLKRANLRLELHGLQIGEQNRLSEILERHLNATDSMLGNHQEQLIQARQDLDEQRNETGFQLDILEQRTSVSEQKFVHDLAQALKKELGSFNNFHSIYQWLLCWCETGETQVL